MLVANNMAAYPLRISNSVCPLRISNTCLMSVHTIYNNLHLHVETLMFPSIQYTLQTKKKNKNLPALSVLHMAQKIISRQKHNMLSLLHEACLKLLVFFYVVLFTHYSKRLAQILLNPLCVFSLTLWIQTHIHTITHITGIYRITTINVFTFYSDYLDHQLCNNSNQLFAHSTLCMYRCDAKRHFSLNSSLHISQT